MPGAFPHRVWSSESESEKKGGRILSTGNDF